MLETMCELSVGEWEEGELDYFVILLLIGSFDWKIGLVGNLVGFSLIGCWPYHRGDSVKNLPNIIQLICVFFLS